MTYLEISLIIGAGAFCAGMLGALTGLGGGVVIVPLLTLALGVDIRYAIGTSLVAVIATSSGSAAAFVKEGYSNIRVAMFLEIATTMGALMGAFIAGLLSTQVIAVIFGLVLMFSAYFSSRRHDDHATDMTPNRMASRLRMNSSYPTSEGVKEYVVHSIGTGFSLMSLAGILSGLLGLGVGAVKVLAMDQAMKLPFKVSTTTSNFMIGVTAAASAGVYLSRGYIDPALSMPVMLGALAGSLIGARLLMIMHTKFLRILFTLIVFVLAIEMIYNGLTGRI
jgi:uncharacterized protein